MLGKTIAVFAAVLVLGGSSYLAFGNEKDKKSLQGTWNGSAGDKKAQMTIDGDKFTFMFGDSTASGTMKIDASKTPKQIDLAVTKGSDDHTKKYEGKTSKGIFEFDGNKLKWCANEPGMDARPDAFPKSGDDKKFLYITFERAKK
jgi:uncharacterized protein (TIGR03067 family)